MTRLDSCPFCGSNNVLFDPTLKCVVCAKCEATGPANDKTGEAWNASNARDKEEISILLKALNQDRRDRLDRMVAAIISSWTGYYNWPYTPGAVPQHTITTNLALRQIAAIDKALADQEIDVVRREQDMRLASSRAEQEATP